MARNNVEIDSKADRDEFTYTTDIAVKDRLHSEMRVSSVNVKDRYGK